MVGHILFPQLDSEYPSSLSRAVITGQLRDDLQFKGVVITDDLTMEAITDHYSLGEAAVLAIQAGADILLVAHGADHVEEVLKALQNAVTSGKLTEGRIDESVTRILQLKKEYGLTDADSLPAPDLTVLNDEINHTAAAYEKP